MTQQTPHRSRRTALRAAAASALASIAGCLNGSTNNSSETDDTQSPDVEQFQRIAIEETTLVVELAPDTALDQLNLIQPNGELLAQREVATGAQQVSFEIGTAYQPGEYSVIGLRGDETITEKPISVQPELQIREVGLYRNNPEKPWDEVYGESDTDTLKNGEAYVTVENSGSGPEAVIQLVFSGDVPNPVEDPRGSGMHDTEQVVVSPGETVDLFSNSFPFGSESQEGMGCSVDGNTGQFTVTVGTQVGGDDISNNFEVTYAGSTEMSDCEVTISEA